jgi:arylsulfatase A-like enzyme
MACTMDLFTTSLKLAGADLPNDRAIDGLDIRPLLFGTGDVKRDAYFYYRGTRLFAARLGDYKAHYLTQIGYGQPKPDEHTPPLLFNLRIDPSETFNVASNHPTVLTDIAKAVEQHRATVKPVKNQLVEYLPPTPAPKGK